jgi:outer membrane receptor protein involved in Fe transport
MVTERHVVAAARLAKRLNKQVGCAVALTLGLGTAAYAQDAAQPDSGAGRVTLEEITITGSRIRRTTDFDTANPTTVVDSAFLQDLGIVNVGDAIAQLPANVSTFSPTTTGNSSFFAGSTVANLRGLNPFFGSRTLTLINNRRFVPTNQGDGVDLNFIPSVLVDRIDVVTGGASAAYGSGAISGVNNIFLDRTLQGGKVDVDFGQSFESDARDRHVGLAYGARLFGGRGNVVVGYEHQKSDAVGCLGVRDWCDKGVGFYQNPVVPGGTNRANGSTAPIYILGSNLRANQISNAGVWNTSSRTATQTLQTNAAGTGTLPFNLGQQPYAGISQFNLVQGGDGRSIYEYTNLRSPVKRNVATGLFTLALTDTINMSVDLSYGKVETVNVTGALDANANQIRPDNAFLVGLPELIAAQAAGANGGPFAAFNKDWTSQTNPYTSFDTDVKRGAVGFDGKFGDSTWTWDGYYQYGKTKRRQFVNDNRHLIAYNLAIDSVTGPGGVPMCRVTRDGVPAGATYDPRLAIGCVPLNPFGTGTISPAAKAYAFGFLDEQLAYEQQVIAFNSSGNLFDGFAAGPIQGAIGVEYRTEKGENLAAQGIPDYVRTDYLIQYGESFSGDVDITEGYLETNLPVLRGVTGAQRLEFNAAVRESQYKNKGKAGTTGESRTHDMFTWKVSGIWDPVEWLRLRGSQSRDSRAANFRELYYGQKIAAGGTFGYCGPAGSFQVDPCNFSLEGNVDLKPEQADTTTAGFVFTPKQWIAGLQFAADYFRIEVTDAIQQGSSRLVLDGCRLRNNPADCALLTPDTPGDYTSIRDLRALSFNGSSYLYEGIDFTGSYLLKLAGDRSVNFRLIATRMLTQEFQSTPRNPVVDLLGQTGTSNSFLADNQPSAKWIANLSTTYSQGRFSATGNVRYVSSGIMNYLANVPGDPGYPGVPTAADGTALPGGTTMSTNAVPSYAVFALSGSYSFDNLGNLRGLQVFAVIDNLFDKDPPVAAGVGNTGPVNNNGGTNAVFYDTLGRSFKIGARTTF